MTTGEEQPWPEELREIIGKAVRTMNGFATDWDAANRWDRARWLKAADPILSAIAGSPYTVVRGDEYEALRSFWSYTESGMDIVALSPAEELRAIYAERTGGSDE